MTLILGSRCTDGVVMIGDLMVTGEGGSERVLQDKLQSKLDKHVWGASGDLAFFTSFKYRVKVLMTERGKGGKVEAWRILPLMEAAYAEIITMYPFSFQFAIASMDRILVASSIEAKSKLYLIEGWGFHLDIENYKVIGIGSPYAELFLKKLWKPSMNMEEVAELGYFAISLIEKYGLDATVGVGDKRPQIYFLPDGQPMREANKYELDSMKEKVDKKVSHWDTKIEEFLNTEH